VTTREHLPLGTADVVLRLAIVALALSTAIIHFTLGGARFTLNALGYVFWAGAIVVPFATARRYRWLIRIGLAAYAAVTIVAWAIEGPSYATAYHAKVIELALVTLVAVDFARRDGNPIDRIRDEVRAIRGTQSARTS
jgi:hypothetical protein